MLSSWASVGWSEPANIYFLSHDIYFLSHDIQLVLYLVLVCGDISCKLVTKMTNRFHTGFGLGGGWGVRGRTNGEGCSSSMYKHTHSH